MIYIGADHRGFELKEQLKKRLISEGYEVTDLGNNHLDPNDDFVDFAQKVAEAVTGDPKNRGIALCGSGIGMSIAANKLAGARVALVWDTVYAKQAREHLDANILALPAERLDEESAWEIIQTFLTTDFSGEERYLRRLNKLAEIEKKV